MAQSDADIGDAPTAPETETYEKVATDPDDGTEIRFEFEADPETGQIHWTAEWDGGEDSGRTSRLNERKSAILYTNAHVNSKRLDGSKLEGDLFKALQADLAAVQDYRADLREWEAEQERQTDLTLTVTEITWQSGTHRTKYTRQARVLSPNKAQRHWTDDEQDAMDALARELGEANDLPRAEPGDDESNPFADVDEGTEFSLDEALDRADASDELADVEDECAREAALEALHDDYPQLRGVDVDPEDARAAFDEAAETGDPVEMAGGTDRCSDPSAECNLDLLTYRATPDGDVDIERTHTY